MEDLAQHILDIAINSVEAGATGIEIHVREDTAQNVMEFIVRDNGRGIRENELPKVMDPFYTTKKHKRVGLGIPLLQEAVQRCDGKLEIKALSRRGTQVRAVFPHNHLDRAPLGDIAGTLITLLAGHAALHIKYSYQYNGKVFYFDTKEFITRLQGIALQTPRVLTFLEDYLNHNISDLRRETSEEFGRTG